MSTSTRSRRRRVPPSSTATSYAEIHQGCLAGIDAEIRAATRAVASWGGSDPILVKHARLELSEHDRYRYVLDVDRAVDPPRFTSLGLSVDQVETRCLVDHAVPSLQKLAIFTDQPFDVDDMQGAMLYGDATSVLRAMRSRLGLIAPDRNHHAMPLLHTVLGLAPSRVGEAWPTHPSIAARGLNRGQVAAISRAVGSSLALVLGPPGTGKTKTLGCLVAELVEGRGRRVLLCAHTNVAVDTALASVMESLSPGVATPEGVVRIGWPSAAFAGRYAPFQPRSPAALRARLQSASVVAVTLSRLAWGLPDDLTFDTAVIDELSMAQIPQVMLAAACVRDQVIGLGDPIQLPPVVQARHAEAQRWLSTDLFAHLGLASPETPDERRPMLQTQFRMAPPIRRVVSRLFYADQLDDAPATAGLAPTDGTPSVLLVDTSALDATMETVGGSRMNLVHAMLDVSIARALHEHGHGPVGVITPYAAQAHVVREELRDHAAAFFAAGGFVRSIHRAQGGEQRVIILDLCDAPPRPSAFLDERRNVALLQLLCVASSRARSRLIVVAHQAALRAAYTFPGALIPRVLDALADVGRVVRPRGAVADVDVLALLRGTSV